MKARFTKMLVLLTAVFCLSFASNAWADPYGLDTAQEQSGLPTSIAGGETTVPGVIGKLITYGLSIIGIVFFFLVIYAGFLWMSAMGNTEKTESAKAILEAAIIGLVLVLGAYAITNFVFEGLTGGSSSTNTQSSSAGGSAVAAYKCKGGDDGEKCSDGGGTQCVGGKCVIPCMQNPEFFGKDPGCIEKSMCDIQEQANYISTQGLCPAQGGNIVCCHKA